MKKSRVFINTNLNSYLSFFLSFIKKDKYSFIFLNKLKKFLKNKNILLTSQGRVALYLIAKNLVRKKNIF